MRRTEEFLKHLRIVLMSCHGCFSTHVPYQSLNFGGRQNDFAGSTLNTGTRKRDCCLMSLQIKMTLDREDKGRLNRFTTEDESAANLILGLESRGY